MMIAGTERRRQGCSLQDGKQWGKSTGQTTTFPIAFTVSALNGFTQYNETGNATGNADQTITSLSKTSITTYQGYGYNYWVIGH